MYSPVIVIQHGDNYRSRLYGLHWFIYYHLLSAACLEINMLYLLTEYMHA
jgi:hypothetical protein